MPRPRTGSPQLGPDGVWRVRVTVDVPKTPENPKGKDRPWYDLGTTDEGLALRKTAKLLAELAAGRFKDAGAAVDAPDKVADYAKAWLAKRTARGEALAEDDGRILERDVLPKIGALFLCDVRPAHVRTILDAAIARGLRRATVAHVRGALSRLLDAAWRDELIAENPAARVKAPKMRETRRERAILADAEFGQLMAYVRAPLELKMLCLVARCEGGMRSGDLSRWDWTHLDLVGFLECIVPRAKTGRPQTLAIPDVLRPFLRAWWTSAGEPTSGPVFPVQKGKRAGESRAGRGVTHAHRLRRELLRAGVKRHECTRPDDAGPPKRNEPCCPNMARDELYTDTESTLRVDFHSFRRAFASALAEAGVNVQRAQLLTGHSDPAVHQRYVMRTAAMRAIPDAALPRLDTAAIAGIVQRADETPSGALLASVVSSSHVAHFGSIAQSVELRTFNRTEDAKTPSNVAICGAADPGAVEPDSRCSAVTRDDSSGSVRPPSPRAGLLADLSARLAELIATGDVEGARVVTATIATLLGTPGGDVASVHDLAAERRRR